MAVGDLQDAVTVAVVARKAPLAERSGKRIGRFELIRELARGGMGQVFLARDTKLGRKVAIKFLLDDDEEFMQRFLLEARATARCTHENIISIYEVGEHEGLPYMVLELLEGKTLSEVIDARVSPHELAELMVPVARALERAHEHGIVHRDLKPSNIFVTNRGQVKVLDFGIARLLDRSDPVLARFTAAMKAVVIDPSNPPQVLTQVSSLIGTLPFMSPEQWGCDSVDHLSDLWALGIIFWRGLVGRHPIGLITAERLQEELSQLDRPMPSILTQDLRLPRELAAIVDRCLAKRKADRYQTAGELLGALQAFLSPEEERALDEVCPYRGLDAFGEGDARYFFGRSNEIRGALALLASSPLLAVVGPSGAGKSSFVHAGVVPAMRAAHAEMQVHIVRPGRAPLVRLATVLEKLATAGAPAPEFVAQLREAPGFFGVMVRNAAVRSGQRILLVVDQLEELFTLCESDADRAVFLSALLAAADDPSSPVRLILSMRADFFDRLASYKPLMSELVRGLFFLAAPDLTNLREAIERPAHLSGLAFEPGIVDDMLKAASSRGALSLVSFAAMRLWEARDRQRKLLTAEAYNQMGGVGGAFARRADEVAAAVPSQSQPLLRAVMTRLVTPEGTRAVVDQLELLSLSPRREQVGEILDHLAHGRLIHVHTDPHRGTTVEIVHEALITEWPLLQRWLEDSHAMRGFMDELQRAARLWVARDRSTDLVWRGTTAREALGHLQRHVFDLSVVEREFVAAVKALVARGRRRRVLAIASVLVALGLVFVGGSIAVIKISLAEREAQANATNAVEALGQVQAARTDLQRQLDVIAEKERARLEAEARRVSEEQKRLAAESELATATASGVLTREQLEAANQLLTKRVVEVQAAKEKAQAAETAARVATEAARAATAKTEQLLARERAARQKAEAELSKIDQRKLE